MYWIWVTNHWNVPRKSAFHLLFRLPKSPFGEHKVARKRTRVGSMIDTRHRVFQVTGQFYAPQTKILQRVTKDEMRVFEILFKGVSTGFGLRTIETYLENPHFIFCSVFQNLRLGSINFLDLSYQGRKFGAVFQNEMARRRMDSSRTLRRPKSPLRGEMTGMRSSMKHGNL